ncbi:LacI family DNA-binding transcriptional regulator [Mammaliicoccus sciuri]|nr:LacI family DNA-binding transcriptional regulator [Mammaliicoccus sciuri]
MVTIKDVAKEANVAPSTVSRVISGHKSISDKTSKKVKAVMKSNWATNLILPREHL